MNLGSTMISLGDKGSQSVLSQRGKNHKIKAIELSIEKCFD